LLEFEDELLLEFEDELLLEFEDELLLEFEDELPAVMNESREAAASVNPLKLLAGAACAAPASAVIVFFMAVDSHA
jgi:hypothetical protein